MQFKLIIALVEDTNTDQILLAAREAGATGATVLPDARGEGLRPQKIFFGLALESKRNMLLFIVEEHLSRSVLEKIAEAGEFEKPGTGVAFKIDIEDAIGFNTQISAIVEEVEDQL